MNTAKFVANGVELRDEVAAALQVILQEAAASEHRLTAKLDLLHHENERRRLRQGLGLE